MSTRTSDPFQELENAVKSFEVYIRSFRLIERSQMVSGTIFYHAPDDTSLTLAGAELDEILAAKNLITLMPTASDPDDISDATEWSSSRLKSILQLLKRRWNGELPPLRRVKKEMPQPFNVGILNRDTPWNSASPFRQLGAEVYLIPTRSVDDESPDTMLVDGRGKLVAEGAVYLDLNSEIAKEIGRTLAREAMKHQASLRRKNTAMLVREARYEMLRHRLEWSTSQVTRMPRDVLGQWYRERLPATAEALYESLLVPEHMEVKHLGQIFDPWIPAIMAGYDEGHEEVIGNEANIKGWDLDMG